MKGYEREILNSGIRQNIRGEKSKRMWKRDRKG